MVAPTVYKMPPSHPSGGGVASAAAGRVVPVRAGFGGSSGGGRVCRQPNGSPRHALLSCWWRFGFVVVDDLVFGIDGAVRRFRIRVARRR
jgi:hypothetical protein